MRWKAHPPNERGAPREIVDAEIVAKGLGEKLIPIACHGSGIRQLFFAQRSRNELNADPATGQGRKVVLAASACIASPLLIRRCHSFVVRQAISPVTANWTAVQTSNTICMGFRNTDDGCRRTSTSP
jgi:hypothetical protein